MSSTLHKPWMPCIPEPCSSCCETAALSVRLVALSPILSWETGGKSVASAVHLLFNSPLHLRAQAFYLYWMVGRVLASY